MATASQVGLVQRVLASAAGAAYASYAVRVTDQMSNQPLRIYSDAAGQRLLSASGATVTNANGLVSFYTQNGGRPLKIQVFATNNSIVDTFGDILPGDPTDIDAASVEFLTAGRITSSQAAVAVNTDLVLNSAINGSLALDTATGIITLKAGRTYKLEAGLAFDTFSDATGGVLTVQWVDSANAALFTSKAVCKPTGNTVASNNAPYTGGVYKALVDTAVKLRVTAATGTAALIVGGASVSVFSLN